MIGYRKAGIMPQKPHSVLRDESGKMLYEHCFTRDGFDGPFSILYHQNPPQNHGEGSAVAPLWPGREEEPEGATGPLRRRHFQTQASENGGTPTTGRIPLLFNTDMTIGSLRPTASDDFYFSNGDGDDLFYCHQGGGTLLSWFGTLSFGPGDYVLIPRSVLHRIELNGEAQHWLWMECRSGLRTPNQYRNPVGQLRMDAPYSHRDFRSPEWTNQVDEGTIKRTITKRRDRFTEHQYPHCPMDVVGWDGTVYPLVFPIEKFSPKIGAYHLPPTVHGTFATGGSLVCSFVPRNVDFGEGAIPCPYPHSNVNVDEVLFYCAGNFTSRKGIDSGSISYHPAGVVHGPHPGAYEASVGSASTQEMAVMIDTFEPLRTTYAGRKLEAPEYDETWTP